GLGFDERLGLLIDAE
ncbi:MAG: IstB-like ATP-binding domain-containing protein, partial [Myxococcales bacterium]|nr:IstB-like ATP-binding domain-containing protein [Myxococcales bacterium]